MTYETFYNSPVGCLKLISDGTFLTGLQRVTPPTEIDFDAPKIDVFFCTQKWLNIYFSGIAPDFLPPIKLNGTPFQHSVWSILQTVPFGQLITYGDIATQIAKQRGIKKMSAQAVGLAVGANPIGIIVPCHRVIGAHNSLTGYAGGLKMKKMLLDIEGVDTSLLSVPRQSRFYDF